MVKSAVTRAREMVVEASVDIDGHEQSTQALQKCAALGSSGGGHASEYHERRDMIG